MLTIDVLLDSPLTPEAQMPDLLTPAEAAAYLRISPATLQRMVRRGLPSKQLGPRQRRFVRSDLEAWLASGEAPKGPAGSSPKDTQ